MNNNNTPIVYETLPDQIFIGISGPKLALNSTDIAPSEIISKTFDTLIQQLDACVKGFQPVFTIRPSAILYNQEETTNGTKYLLFQVGYFCTVKEYQTWFHTNETIKQQFTSHGIQWTVIPGGHFAKTTHWGSYDTLSDHWMQFMNQLAEQKMIMDWNAWTNWEWNLKSMREVSDSNHFVTELWQRIIQ